MVGPSWWPRTRTTRCLVAAELGLGLVLCGLAGCSFVPQARLDDCHRLSQTLQAENARLKDTTVSLRSQNQDLNQRAVDDARRLRLQEEEIQRLAESVTAYQEERDQLAAAFERIKSQIRTSLQPVSSGLARRLEALARAHPGWEFDAERGLLTIPAALWFEAGSDRLRSEARAQLAELAAVWGAPDAGDVDLLIVGRNEMSAVRRAGLAPPEEEAPARSLGHDRAARVRDQLVTAARIDPARIEVAGFEVPHAGAVGRDEASQARNRRIEIHLHRQGDDAGVPDPPGPPEAAGRSDP
jgi:chemotaxis protein MotB